MTADDINTYVTTEFSNDATLRRLVEDDPATSRQIIDEILDKASGVFLWVFLVVKSLTESLQNGDDMKDLQRRLSALPADLEPLYKRMIDTIDPFYQLHAAQLFQIVRTAALPLSLLAMFFIGDDPNTALSGKERPISIGEIAKREDMVLMRLKSRCKGLVEASYFESSSTDGDEYVYQTRPRRLAKVQFLHLTVKEFLATSLMDTWLTKRTSTASFNPHIHIANACILQFQATRSLDLYNYNATRHGKYVGPGPYTSSSRRGIIFMVMNHSRIAETRLHKSQLKYLDALETAISASEAHRTKQWEHGAESQDIESGHWSLQRYGDWHEPPGWQSDYVAYLVTIGMTHGVAEIIRRGYNPATKPGRPLLLYAVCPLAPEFAIENLEFDTIDPTMVEELLKRGCNPNQVFSSVRGRDIRELGTKTVWEATLAHVWYRFCGNYTGHRVYSTAYIDSLSPETVENLLLRWLKTFQLFLHHGAVPNAIVSPGDGLNMSALSLFDQVFSGLETPLFAFTREFLVRAKEQEIPIDFQDANPDEYERSLRSPPLPESREELQQVPLPPKSRATHKGLKSRARKVRSSPLGRCAQS